MSTVYASYKIVLLDKGVVYLDVICYRYAPEISTGFWLTLVFVDVTKRVSIILLEISTLTLQDKYKYV